AFGVDGGVIVYGRAEEGDHPLVDGVFTVVAEPVGDSGSGDGGLEAVGLGDGEHGHESAVAPAGDADAVGIDGVIFGDGIDSREDVAEVAVAKVFAVGLGELFAFAVAAARIGHQDEVSHGGEGRGTKAGRGPVGQVGVGGASVDVDDERVFFGGIVVGGVEQPAVDVEVFVGPAERLGESPRWPQLAIELRNSSEIISGRVGFRRPGPDFGWLIE